jgi:hypothetical protein
MKSPNLATKAQKMPTGIRSEVLEETSKNGPSFAEIRKRALEIYLERGGIRGGDLDDYLNDWLQAERELRKKYNKNSSSNTKNEAEGGTMRVRKNGKLFSSALVVALVLVTAGTLAAQDVRYNFMPRTDFSKYHTYKWVNIGGVRPDQIMDAEVKQAVDSQLAAKGMTKTDSDKADLYIGYQTAVHQETQWDAWGSRAFGMGTGSWTSSTISVGTLVLDMYDPGTKQLVWTGSATKTIDTGSNHEKHMKNLDRAMAKLLKNYPPKQP